MCCSAHDLIFITAAACTRAFTIHGVGMVGEEKDREHSRFDSRNETSTPWGELPKDKELTLKIS